MQPQRLGLLVLIATCPAVSPAWEDTDSVFATDNLVAWCVVPFDADGRSPVERAKMLRSLGIRRLAYDWRDEQIPTFDEEIAAMREHGVEVTAFWLWLRTLEPGADDRARLVLDTLRRNRLATQIWVSFDDRVLADSDQPARVRAVSAALRPIAREAGAIDCQIGLYNHGGWFGHPDNQIEVIQSLGVSNVGVVYNFHHAHHEIDRFEELLGRMKPHLLAINLNGMRRDGPEILPIGAGDHELGMLELIQESGYRGRIGILDHREEVDAEQSLRENLAGLARLRAELAGAAPQP